MLQEEVEEGAGGKGFHAYQYLGMEKGGVAGHRRAQECGPGGPIQEKVLPSHTGDRRDTDEPSQTVSRGSGSKMTRIHEQHANYADT